MIQTYGENNWNTFGPDPKGKYVLYTDHLAAIAEKDKRIKELEDNQATALKNRMKENMLWAENLMVLDKRIEELEELLNAAIDDN